MLNIAIRYLQSLSHATTRFSFNKRFLNLNLFIAFLIIVIVAQSLYSYGYRNSRDVHNHLLLLKNEAYSSNYDSLLTKYEPKIFNSFPLEKKCNLYFDQLHQNNNAWILNNFDTAGYDDNYINFQDFLDFKRTAEKDMVFNEAKILELEKEFNSRSWDSIKVDQRIIDAVTTLRIFGKCFIETEESKKVGFMSSIFEDNKKEKDQLNEGKDLDTQQHLCEDTEARIFPWLSNILPSYTRWDGTVINNHLPDLSKSQSTYDDDEFHSHIKKDHIPETNCFLKNFRYSINGRGIVISASNGQKDELMRLGLILRATNNKLPIQIIHKGDLSEKNQKELIHQFRRPINLDNLPLSFEKLPIHTAPKFPAQDLWFVNVERSIKTEFEGYFQKYANKLLAYLFNSFEDMILIDTDTVPFVDLESILKLPAFEEKGAFFFQDRQLRGSNTQNQVNYFKRLFPSKLDNFFFNIPLVTDFTLKNRFIGDLRNHFMESGVVAVKRTTHFTGMLSAVQLNFWSITARKIHGDKELFWLGQSIAGNENYEFNALGAASIGELTPNDNKLFPKSPANELCGNHPGHINGYDNQTLLWINSGFTFCKNTDAANFDAGKPLFKQYDGEKLKQHYKSVTRIRSAIVPPPQEIPGNNDQGNPDLGWSDAHKYCFSYTWCAYDGVGDMSNDIKKGLLVNFDNQQTRVFDFFGDLWMNGVRKK